MAIGLPVLFNGILIGVIATILGQGIGEVSGRLNGIDGRLAAVEGRVAGLAERIGGMESRMATRDELLRVEQVLDARLKHIEERS